MAENYRLSREQNGPEGSKTYEFSAVSLPKKKKRNPSGRKNLSAVNTAREELKGEQRHAGRSGTEGSRRSGENIRNYSSYHLESKGGSERMERRYEVDVQIDSPSRSSDRYYPSSSHSRGYYVLDKRGKRVSVRTKAEAEKIKKEREEEIAREKEIRRAESAAFQVEKSIRTVKTKSKKPFPVGMVVSIILASVLFMSIVFSAVLLNEKNMDLNNLQSTLSALEEKAKTLQASLDNKNDMAYLEDEAINNLGMVNTDKVARKYIYIQKEEKIELASESTEIVVSSTSILDTLREKIVSFFENIVYFFQ